MRPFRLTNIDLSQLPCNKSDYLVIGTGIAGLYTALIASEHGSVSVLTKRKVNDSNTDMAQGGIAAVFDIDNDSTFLHMEDTLEAGAGLCCAEAVKVLVTEGPERVQELINMGTLFDREDGNISLTREGAHSRRRILHANGDATGEEIRRSLAVQVLQEPNVRVFEDTFVIDLLVFDHECYGVVAVDRNGNFQIYLAKVVILASGGVGYLYQNTTNPEVATGDGVAMAYRAGAALMDVEFVQFHPTALSIPGVEPFLISEAVRGEGAFLRNSHGERFMLGIHDLAELAPRDVVARAITKELRTGTNSQVFLDVRHLDSERIKKRFPKITQTCAKYGIDITKDLIPIAPSAHYFMGGVMTDLDGATSIKGLYACGEVACPGVHGANRLASNSLLDGLVFGGRIVRHSLKRFQANSVPDWQLLSSVDVVTNDGVMDPTAVMMQVKDIMWHHVGILRDATGLKEAIATLQDLQRRVQLYAPNGTGYQAYNMAQAGELIARAALFRTESRGGHFRLDCPKRNDVDWKCHTVIGKQCEGEDCYVDRKSLA